MQKLERIKTNFQKLKNAFKRYERWLMPVTLSAGFLVDYITFVNIEINTALWLLLGYYLMAGLAVLFVHAYDNSRLSDKFRYLRLFAPLLTQFLFGGLLSNSFIFYWFSGSVYYSWPFILAFVFLMVANDALRHWFFKPVVQLSVYFFGTISFISVALPFVFNSIDPKFFVFGSLLSLMLFFLYLVILFLVVPSTKRLAMPAALIAVVICVVMNFFYFKNLIPPVPLALRDSGVFHDIKRSGGDYLLLSEVENFWQKLWPGQSIKLKAGGRVYVYTAIYAPKNFNTPIFHAWQFYDREKNQWVEKDRLEFNLTGGRKSGFRGYSWKTILPEGKWKVLVKTSRGQILGVVNFKIEKTSAPVELIELSK